MHSPESWYLKYLKVGKGQSLIIVSHLERPVSFVHPLNVLGGTGTLTDASSICDVKWFLYLTDIETSLARFVFSQAPLFCFFLTLFAWKLQVLWVFDWLLGKIWSTTISYLLL